MATIIDVAKLAGVSPTTVSFVLNGKGEERNIPLKTCRRIEQAMSTLHYQPNMSARRLRSHDSNKPVVAFFWPMNYLIHIMTMIINGLLNKLNTMNFPCEFVVQTYENDHIDSSTALLIRSEYHAAIIGCASQRDIDYIDSISLNLPLIFVNRISKRYSYVAVDIKKMVRIAAEMFAHKGYRSVGILTSSHSYYASDLRVKYFLEASCELGLSIEDRYVIRTANSLREGFQGMERYLTLSGRPHGLFCNSDMIALGALAACRSHGVSIPRDMEIISVELMDPQFVEYSWPPLTTVSMPTGELSGRIMESIIDALRQKKTLNVQEFCEPEVFIRESFKP
ncbi:MAG: LacI family transcriptional regulator [Synergistaceae bacterium]|jgi:LacI family purine nucleotide synthesis repressor|nr:LacI family transcriptional regulator [Synergistaceae bacterium]